MNRTAFGMCHRNRQHITSHEHENTYENKETGQRERESTYYFTFTLRLHVEELAVIFVNTNHAIRFLLFVSPLHAYCPLPFTCWLVYYDHYGYYY